MDAKDFQVGDRVKLIKDVSHYFAGQVGTVVGVGATVDVKFDEQPENVQFVSCYPHELAEVAVKTDDKTQANAIRESWTRWLANADDAAVIRFHQQVIDLLESERNVNAADVVPFGYGVIDRQLLDDAMDQLGEESEIRKARDLVGHRYRQQSDLKAAISLEMWRQSQNAEERVSGEAEMAKLDPDLHERARSIVASLTADERAACGLLPA